MTLPSLINKTRDREFKTAFKKQYSSFAQAMQRVYIEDGETYELVDWLQMPVYFCKLQNQMRVLKSGINCDEVLFDSNYENNGRWPTTGNYYWHNNGKWYDKKGNPQSLNGGYWSLSYLLPDGGLVVYNCYNQIFIDVNGYKKPNTIGKDIFFMTLETKNMVPRLIYTSGQSIIPNCCSINGINSTPALTIDNYEDDCTNGSGWGCSLMYILD